MAAAAKTASSAGPKTLQSADIPASPDGSIPAGVIAIGDIVKSGDKTGVVRFIGETAFRPGNIWIGLELDEPNGKNDGTVQGVRYFNVKPLFGLFVTINTCIVIDSAAAAAPPTAVSGPASLSRIPSQKRLGAPKTEVKTSSIKKPLVTQSVQRQPSSRTGLAVPGSGGSGNEAPKTSSVKRSIGAPKLSTSSSSSNLTGTGGSVKRIPVKRTDTGLGTLATAGRSTSSTGLHRKSPSVGGVSLHASSSSSSSRSDSHSGTSTPTASPPPEPDDDHDGNGNGITSAPSAAMAMSTPPRPVPTTAIGLSRLGLSAPSPVTESKAVTSSPSVSHTAPAAVMTPTPVAAVPQPSSSSSSQPLHASPSAPVVTVNSSLPVTSSHGSGAMDSPAPLVAIASSTALPTAGVLGIPHDSSSSSSSINEPLSSSSPAEPSSPLAPSGSARFADDDESSDQQTPLPSHDALSSGGPSQGGEIMSPVVARARQVLLDKKMKQKAAKQRTLKGVVSMTMLAAQFAAEAEADPQLSASVPAVTAANQHDLKMSAPLPAAIATGATPDRDGQQRRRSIVALEFAAERGEWEKKLSAANATIASLTSQIKAAEDRHTASEAKHRAADTAGHAAAAAAATATAAADAALTAKIAELESKLKASLSSITSLEAQVVEAQGATEMAILDKSMAEELVAEAKAQTQAAEQKLEQSLTENEQLKEQILDAGKNALAALPKSSEEAAKMVDDNKRLAAALIKLRDQGVAEKTKLEGVIRKLEHDLKDAQAYQIEANTLRPQLDAANTQIADLKVALDEASSYESMVTTLTEQAVELKSELEQLRESSKNLQELVDASDEVEEGHVELEQQLQRELDAKASELGHYKHKLALRTNQVDELQKALRQFRDRVRALQEESENSRTREATLFQDTHQRSEREKAVHGQHLMMQAKFKDFRHRVVLHQLARLEAQQAQRRALFIATYIPDNISIDERSLSLLLLVERLKFKSQLLCSLLDEYYGISHSNSNLANADLSLFAYRAMYVLMELARAVDLLTRAINVSDLDAYLFASARCGEIASADTSLDTLLTLLARDSLSDATPLEPLLAAADEVTRFLSYLAPIPPSSTTSVVADVSAWQLTIPTSRHQAAQSTLRVLSSRSSSPVVAVSFDTQQLYMILLATRVLIQTIGEAISSFTAGLKQARAPPQVAGATPAPVPAAASGEEKALYSSLFHELEDMQLSVFQSCSAALKNAQSFQYQQDNKTMTPATTGVLVAISELVEISARHAMAAQVRLVTILSSVRSLIVDLQSEIARRPRDVPLSASSITSLDGLVTRMDQVLMSELKDKNGLGALARDFENLHVSLQQYGTKLLPGGESPAAVPLLSARALKFALAENFTTLPFGSFAASTPATQQLAAAASNTNGTANGAGNGTGIIVPWEQQATSVRRQLAEAASMRIALEEAEKKLMERKNELFVLQKAERDDRAMIDVLQMHMKKLAPQAEQYQDVKLKLERCEKELQTVRDKFDAQAKENARLSTELGKQRVLAVGMLENKYQDGDEGNALGIAGVRRVAPRRVNNPADLLAGGKGAPLSRAAADEISVLQRTVRMLRRQVADLRGRTNRDDIERALPPLPLVKSRLVAPGHMSDADVAALHAQRASVNGIPTTVSSSATSVASPSGTGTNGNTLTIGVTAASPRPPAATPMASASSSVPRAFTFAIAATPRASSSPAAAAALAAFKTNDRSIDREIAEKKRDEHAISLQREQRRSADQLSSLSHELTRLNQRVNDFRQSATLIDLRADYPQIVIPSETKAKIRSDHKDGKHNDEKHVATSMDQLAKPSAAIQFASRRAAAAQLKHDRSALAERVAAFITSQPAATTAAASALLHAASLPSSLTVSSSPLPLSSSSAVLSSLSSSNVSLIGRIVLPASVEDTLAARLSHANSSANAVAATLAGAKKQPMIAPSLSSVSAATRLILDRDQLSQLQTLFGVTA